MGAKSELLGVITNPLPPVLGKLGTGGPDVLEIKPAVERSPALQDWRETSRNALKEAPKQSAAPTAAAPSKAARSDGPFATITEPMRDVATNPPVRATALFNPEAAPTWCASTDVRTAVVNGATAPPIPSAITTMAGRTPSQ